MLFLVAAVWPARMSMLARKMRPLEDLERPFLRPVDELVAWVDGDADGPERLVC